MYKYKLIEDIETSDVERFQQGRIDAFDKIESRLINIKKLLRQGKLETISYYRQNPNSFSVVLGTDMIDDYFNDIETLLKKEENENPSRTI